MKTVQVQYYAVLREQRGAGSDELNTEADSLRALYDELRARYGFSLDADRLRVAVNSEFRDWAAPLNDGDTVVFIPPVAGG
ncbi:MAG: MoaD/ThiS family protein [FCB group bacterium]|jgi:MoaD family protein|nr:MoaD/ThiS family protein [FCB group bacterium]